MDYYERLIQDCLPGFKLEWRGRRQVVASRTIRQIHREYVGPLRDDQHVHHICGNPWCVRFAHLEALTFSEHIEAHRRARGERRPCRRIPSRYSHEWLRA